MYDRHRRAGRTTAILEDMAAHGGTLKLFIIRNEQMMPYIARILKGLGYKRVRRDQFEGERGDTVFVRSAPVLNLSPDRLRSMKMPYWIDHSVHDYNALTTEVRHVLLAINRELRSP